jgi:hypothetical protein
VDAGDTRTASAIIGEAAGLIHDIAPAAKILHDLVTEAENILGQKAPKWVSA